MTVRLFNAELNQLLTAPNSPVDRHLRAIADTTRVRAFAYASRDTGELANSIGQPQREADGTYTITASANHAMAVHEGSRSHIVRATNANALHFSWRRRGGIETFVPKRASGRTYIDEHGALIIGKGFVVIPAIAGKPFLLRALENTVQST